MSQGLERVRKASRERKEERFTTLLHHVSEAALKEAYYALKRDASAGVDGVTWRDYEGGLADNLRGLHDRVHSGAYRAQPSRRVYIGKADGGQRPLAVAALEDKIVQGAVSRVLSAVYEEDFLDFSYGFRPGRGPHDALDALATAITGRKVNWILDADIRAFFDTVSHEWLIRFVEHRIGDRRIVRLIRKWLRSGVLEDGTVTRPDRGTGQGAVISPLLANVYLHYVLDLWAQRWRRREARGDMIIVRYADDVVLGFELEADARRFLEAMRARLAQFELALHPDKTRLIAFGRHAARERGRQGLGKPETFDFLGFTHICARTRKGRFMLKRKCRRKKVLTKLKEVKKELRRRMHQSVAEQGKWLGQVVSGFMEYYAVPTNVDAVSAFRYQVLSLWKRSLSRRSQTAHLTWTRFAKLVDEFLPTPRILHPWPDTRFRVRHPRWEPYAGKPHVRFCAGGAP